MRAKYLLVKESADGKQSLVMQSHDFLQVEKGMEWLNRVADRLGTGSNYFTAGWEWGQQNGLVK